MQTLMNSYSKKIYIDHNLIYLLSTLHVFPFGLLFYLDLVIKIPNIIIYYK